MQTTEFQPGPGVSPTRELELRCVLALNRVSGIGPMRASRLISAFGSARGVLSASKDALAAAGILNEAGIRAVHASRSVPESDPTISFFRRRRGRVGLLLQSEAAYPDLLRQISQSPSLLWTRGRWVDETAPAVAIVGSREATEWGRTEAWNWAFRLASAGVTIVSGLARGIDTAAHLGALDAGGHTIAVMGTGIDRIYPSQNRQLAVEIERRGVLMTEFDPGLGARPHHFPRRNRIIAGLSHVVVVIEAGSGSGSLITADLAQEAGRDVGIVPGRPGDANAAGANAAIKANLGELMTDPGDVLRILRDLPGLSWRLPDHEQAAIGSPQSEGSTEKGQMERLPTIRGCSVEGIIRSELEAGPASMTRLVALAGLEREKLEEAMLDLLIDGRVTLGEDQRYRWLR